MTPPPMDVILAPDRAGWLEARRQGIGASDAAAVLGVSAWASPLTLYYDKLGAVPEDVDVTADLERLEWGQALEGPIAARYQRETGRRLEDPGRYTIQRSRDHPFMLATLDRRQYWQADDRLLDDGQRRQDGPGVLEIKNVGGWRPDDWQDEPPLAYQIQVQHQLAVTGYSWASLAVLLGGQRFLWYDLPRNQEFIDALIGAERDFWLAVQTHNPPPPDASDACRDLLRRLYPTPTPGKVVALPGDARAWDAARLDAKDRIKAAEADLRLADNQLIAALGDAEAGILPDGTRYSFKAVSRAGYTVGPTTYRQLRRTAAR